MSFDRLILNGCLIVPIGRAYRVARLVSAVYSGSIQGLRYSLETMRGTESVVFSVSPQ